jgi:hypothetical protein
MRRDRAKRKPSAPAAALGVARAPHPIGRAAGSSRPPTVLRVDDTPYPMLGSNLRAFTACRGTSRPQLRQHNVGPLGAPGLPLKDPTAAKDYHCR